MVPHRKKERPCGYDTSLLSHSPFPHPPHSETAATFPSAVRKIPEIVAQHAVVAWKDGVETLVISSALDSEAQTLGWIIPVPAVPSQMEKATPGSLKTLDFCIQPSITHDLSPLVRSAIWAVLIGNLLVGTWLFQRKRFGCVAAWIFNVLVLYCLLMPAGLGTVRGGAERLSATQVEKTATVGSYSISVLKSARSESLNDWLAANGFAALPEAAGPTVADYITRGWVFVAIKLTRSEAGANVPHPVKLVFASQQAVYPMKLTALAGGKPAFQFFVIGNERASCDALHEEFCDRFSKSADNELGSRRYQDFKKVYPFHRRHERL